MVLKMSDIFPHYIIHYFFFLSFSLIHTMNHVPSMLAQFLWNFIIAYVLTPIIYVVIFPFWVCYFVYDLFTRKHVPAPEGILITGASSGIGEGLAYYYAQHSAKVLYLFGQNEERLNNTKENCLKYNPELSVFTYQGDITDEKVFNERIQSIVQKNNVRPCSVLPSLGRSRHC